MSCYDLRCGLRFACCVHCRTDFYAHDANIMAAFVLTLLALKASLYLRLISMSNKDRMMLTACERAKGIQPMKNIKSARNWKDINNKDIYK